VWLKGRYVLMAVVAVGLAVATAAIVVRRAPARVLRVCADPNNLPFSDQKGRGFENEIAELLADRMDARLEYTWFAQRRGFVRNTLRADRCDVIIGVPSSFELALVTRPYYRSSYVFVTRQGGPDIESFDDPDLRRLRVGVHLVGDDYTNTPPAHALAARGVISNVRGYTLYGDYREPHPPSRILDALLADEIDVAIIWGPLAGWYAATNRVSLKIEPVRPQIDLPFLPMVFDISMGVRRTDLSFRDELDRIIEENRPAIDRILEKYGVPRLTP